MEPWILGGGEYEGYYQANRGNMIMYQILDDNTETIDINFLNMIIIHWLSWRRTLFLGETCRNISVQSIMISAINSQMTQQTERRTYLCVQTYWWKDTGNEAKC